VERASPGEPATDGVDVRIDAGQSQTSKGWESGLRQTFVMQWRWGEEYDRIGVALVSQRQIVATRFQPSCLG
jgi:hypothetical protein